jgi:hypothetical protein
VDAVHDLIVTALLLPAFEREGLEVPTITAEDGDSDTCFFLSIGPLDDKRYERRAALWLDEIKYIPLGKFDYSRIRKGRNLDDLAAFAAQDFKENAEKYYGSHEDQAR